MLTTHQLDSLDKRQVVRDDFAKLREVPAVPFTRSHHVVIKFLIDIIEQRYCLHYHCVHFVWTELQLVPRQTTTNSTTDQHQGCVSAGRNLFLLRQWFKPV